MTTVTDAPPDGKAFGLGEINAEPLNAYRATGKGLFDFEDFGIIRGSEWAEFHTYRNAKGDVTGVEFWVKHPDFIGPTMKPRVDSDDLGTLSIIVDAIIGITPTDVHDLGVRDRVRGKWNAGGDVGQHIYCVQQEIETFFWSECGYALHPALALWASRIIAWFLFIEEHLLREEAEQAEQSEDARDCLDKEALEQIAEDERLRDECVPPELIAHRDKLWKELARTHTAEAEKAYLQAVQDCEAFSRRIQINNKQPREITKRVINVLRRAKTKLYARGNHLARITIKKVNAPAIETLSDEWLRGQVHHDANIIKVSAKASESPDCLPMEHIKEARSFGLDQFPALEGLTASPFRPDGTLARRGYDPTTQLYHEVPVLPPIPPNPSGEDVRRALRIITDALQDFPFEDEASRANAIAAYLTIVVRPMIRGEVPAFTVTAPKPGSGKTYLVEFFTMAALGIRISATPLAGGEEERRKIIFSLLLSSPPVVLFDNCTGTLSSSALAGTLTAGSVQDRVLGKSETKTVPTLSTIFITGNNLVVSGELCRRRVPIHLDAKMAHPETRTFSNPDLLSDVREHRVLLLHAACVLVWAWVKAGKPRGENASMSSFGRWAETVGGILHHSGVPGFLANLSKVNKADDVEGAEWEGFLAFIHKVYDDGWFYVRDIADHINRNQCDEWTDRLPGDLAEKLSKAPRMSRHVLGAAFRDRKKARYGSYHFESREGEDKTTQWRVVKED